MSNIEVEEFSSKYLGRKITFFNMNFGDSFLIEEGKSGLLVDCGSYKQSIVRRRYMASLIANKIKEAKQKDLLITHYHKDHFSLLLDVVNNGVQFQTIYVRCLSPNVFKFTFYSAVTSLIDYIVESQDYNTFIHWLDYKLLYNLLLFSGRVVGINSDVNNTFHIGTSTATVLWPSSTTDAQCYRDVDEYYRVLLLPDDKNDNHVYKRIKSLFELYYSINAQLIDSEGMLSRDSLFALINSYSNESEKIDIDDVISFVNSIKVSRKMKNKLSSLENHLSLVFEVDSSLLMTGDADNGAMDNAMKQYCINYQITDDNPIYPFSIIKVPHHGTKKYYYDFNSQLKWLLIPNSKRYRNWTIDDKYVLNCFGCVSLNNSHNTACPRANKGKCHLSCKGCIDNLTVYF